MAKNTKHLPIYKMSYELVKIITDSARHFSRDFRPTLGATMSKEALDLVLCVYRANAATDKVEHIELMLEKMQVLEMLIQMSFDLRLLSPTVYAACIDMTESIGKQAGGWKKFAERGSIPRSNQPFAQ